MNAVRNKIVLINPSMSPIQNQKESNESNHSLNIHAQNDIVV